MLFLPIAINKAANPLPHYPAADAMADALPDEMQLALIANAVALRVTATTA